MLIQVTRGIHIESVHEIEWIAMDSSGRIVESGGDTNTPVFPRSAIKMIQILPLMRKKAACALASAPEDIACGCASHSGEDIHIAVVQRWLSRLGLNESHLACGAHWPFDEDTARRMQAEGKIPTRLHNNCSGKHTSQLEFAQLLGAPVEGYHNIDHPVQKAIRQEMETMSEVHMKDGDWGIDGCGIPAWKLPLSAFARMMSRFAGEAARAGTVERTVFDAFVAHPFLTSGTLEFCGQAMKAAGGQLLLKVGAEGVMTAVLPSKNLAIVLKTKDGAERACETAMAALVARLTPELAGTMAPWSDRTLKNWAGTPVGSIRATF